jgi:hypothetical protein
MHWESKVLVYCQTQEKPSSHMILSYIVIMTDKQINHI